MARTRKNISEPRSETITISLSSAEREVIDAAARAAGMSRSAYAVARILAPQRTGVFRIARRQDVAAALTDAARSLEEIARGIDGAAPIEALTVATALLGIERAMIAAVGPEGQDRSETRGAS